jgi:cytochrome d ubiquinol oxidase subunit II
VLCGVALLLGYALQGACWLILRTDGELLRSARRHARTLGMVLLALIVVISLWTPLLNDVYWRH